MIESIKPYGTEVDLTRFVVLSARTEQTHDLHESFLSELKGKSRQFKSDYYNNSVLAGQISSNAGKTLLWYYPEYLTTTYRYWAMMEVVYKAAVTHNVQIVFISSSLEFISTLVKVCEKFNNIDAVSGAVVLDGKPYTFIGNDFKSQVKATWQYITNNF